MKRRESAPWWVWFIVVIVVLLVIVVFVASLGTLGVERQLLDEFKDSKDEALRKHKALLAELDNKKALKKKLDRQFRYSYLVVRIILVIACSVSVFYIGYLLGAQTLDDFLNYYEASIIALFAMNFIAFGTIANFHNFIYVLRTRVENWVWSKHVTLPKEIDSITKEIEILNGQIDRGATIIILPENTEVEREKKDD